MLQSRKDEFDEQEDELIEEVAIAGSGGDGNENLSLAERRALMKARRQQDKARTQTEDDDEDGLRGSAITASKEERGIKTRSRAAAEQERQRQVQGRAENVPLVGGVVGYFRSVRAEILKVTWPTREEAWRLTRIVLVVTIIASIILGAVDFLYGSWFSASIENNNSFILGLIPFAIAASFFTWLVFVQSAE
jgi:preprotein translocase subunit SecE